MNCEAHPDTDDQSFECSGDLEVVYNPSFVDDAGVVHPHWNGAPAFAQPPGELVPSHSMPTAEALLLAERQNSTVTLVGFVANGLARSLRKAADFAAEKLERVA